MAEKEVPVPVDDALDREIEQAIADGKGWTPEDRQKWLDGIGDNHPFWAEKLEVSRERRCCEYADWFSL